MRIRVRSVGLSPHRDEGDRRRRHRRRGVPRHRQPRLPHRLRQRWRPSHAGDRRWYSLPAAGSSPAWPTSSCPNGATARAGGPTSIGAERHDGRGHGPARRRCRLGVLLTWRASPPASGASTRSRRTCSLAWHRHRHGGTDNARRVRPDRQHGTTSGRIARLRHRTPPPRTRAGRAHTGTARARSAPRAAAGPPVPNPPPLPWWSWGSLPPDSSPSSWSPPSPGSSCRHVARDEADKRRRAFRHTPSSYLDLAVNVLLAGGVGHRDKGCTPPGTPGWLGLPDHPAELVTFRLTGQSPWDTFAQLDARLGINELAELAASVSLAGSPTAHGIWASLAAKARHPSEVTKWLKPKQLRKRLTERMTVPVAVLLFGFSCSSLTRQPSSRSPLGQRTPALNGANTRRPPCPYPTPESFATARFGIDPHDELRDDDRGRRHHLPPVGGAIVVLGIIYNAARATPTTSRHLSSPAAEPPWATGRATNEG